MDGHHVLGCDRHLAELLAAETASEGLGLGMGSVVVFEIPNLRERFLAVIHQAMILPFEAVCGRVHHFCNFIHVSGDRVVVGLDLNGERGLGFWGCLGDTLGGLRGRVASRFQIGTLATRILHF